MLLPKLITPKIGFGAGIKIESGTGAGSESGTGVDIDRDRHMTHFRETNEQADHQRQGGHDCHDTRHSGEVTSVLPASHGQGQHIRRRKKKEGRRKGG
ncbi:hypothetical protein EVAR_99093_1 [Eumeta japonica]|uniref:Uncharacterized protein n=1 Tax=Eumeta variegata TaxID=151549 RepID=A0A4C2A9E7_EUMVA|nr:hypothetical protein EVAR_99093_1 [Eumeta japonica]